MVAVTSDESPDEAVFVIWVSSGSSNTFERSIGRSGSSSLAAKSEMGVLTLGGSSTAKTVTLRLSLTTFPLEEASMVIKEEPEAFWGNSKESVSPVIFDTTTSGLLETTSFSIKVSSMSSKTSASSIVTFGESSVTLMSDSGVARKGESSTGVTITVMTSSTVCAREFAVTVTMAVPKALGLKSSVNISPVTDVVTRSGELETAVLIISSSSSGSSNTKVRSMLRSTSSSEAFTSAIGFMMTGGSLGANTVTLKTSLTVSPFDEAVTVTVVELLASGWKSRVRVSPSTEAITVSGFEDVAVFEIEALSSSTSLNTLERSIVTFGAVFKDDKSEIEFKRDGSVIDGRNVHVDGPLLRSVRWI